MLTEKDAATEFARAWNNLDSTNFLKLLDENAIYSSHWVISDMEGKSNISEYLIRKMEVVSNEASVVKAELGTATISDHGRDCVIMTQGENDEVITAVVFKVNEGKIISYHMTEPEFYWPKRSGVFPA